MSQKNEGNFNTLPVGRLGIIPLAGCITLGQKVDNYLVQWRTGRGNAENEKYIAEYEGYERSSYILKSQTPRGQRCDQRIRPRRRHLHSG